MPHALVVDDDIESARSLRDLIARQGLTVATAQSIAEARRQIALQQPDILMLDLQLPDGSGMELMADPVIAANAEIVLCTGHASVDTSVQALRLGAADYLVKPINHTHLRGLLSRLMKPAVLQGEVQTLQANLQTAGHFGHLWGTSRPMQRLYEQIGRVAGTGITVFITGESGTGKEVVAQTVHDLSRRRNNPFIAVNCGAMSPQLIESEIFGHEKGSFTGAERQHQGFFERARGGTLFLDEITEMPLDLQVKLLRVLETGRFMRVGGTTSQETDVRIIAATNRVPERAVAAGRMREDLLYRLNVFPLAIPPLRERLSDVPLLANHFLRLVSEQEGRQCHFTDAALKQLQEFDWPGNVRELRNAVQRAYVMATGGEIGCRWLPRNDRPAAAPPAPQKARFPLADAALEASSQQARGPAWPGGEPTGATITLPIGISADAAVQALTLATLQHFNQHKERTAAALGISLKTLYNRLREYAAGGDAADLDT